MERVCVSVIIPVYNAEKTIERCIESIANQTYKNVQIICVDDGSTDNSNKIIKQLMKKEKRLELIEKSNGGVSSARNIGIEHSKGKYIEFVDSDDAISERMIETLVKSIEKDKTDIVICGYKVYGKGKICSLKSNVYLNKDEFYNDFYSIYSSTYLNPPWNKLFRRESITELFDENIDIGEDLIFNLNYINKIDTISTLSEPLYIYTPGTENSLTIKYNSKSIDALISIILTIQGLVPEDKYNKFKGAIADCYFNDLQRDIKSLINKSNKSVKEIKNEINMYRKNEIIRKQILENTTINNIDCYVIFKANTSCLIYYYKIKNIKSMLVSLASKFKKSILIRKKEYRVIE